MRAIALPVVRPGMGGFVSGGKVRQRAAYTVLLGALTLVTWASPGRAQPALFFADGGTHDVYRANVDGSGLVTLMASGLSTPQGLAIDATHGKLYVTDIDTGKIWRANLDGSGVEDL